MDSHRMGKWYKWLEYMKKNDEKETMEEMHQRKVEKMIKSAEGSAWRGGVQILEKEDEDARLLDRCEAKRKEWSHHWQCNEEIHGMQDKPGRNEELRESEEALPRLKRRPLGKGIESVQGKNRSGMQRIPSKSFSGLDKRNERRNCGILGEGGTEWQTATTSLHNDVLLDSQECLE